VVVGEGIHSCLDHTPRLSLDIGFVQLVLDGCQILGGDLVHQV
jgi:hypothetical protein